MPQESRTTSTSGHIVFASSNQVDIFWHSEEPARITGWHAPSRTPALRSEIPLIGFMAAAFRSLWTFLRRLTRQRGLSAKLSASANWGEMRPNPRKRRAAPTLPTRTASELSLFRCPLQPRQRMKPNNGKVGELLSSPPTSPSSWHVSPLKTQWLTM